MTALFILLEGFGVLALAAYAVKQHPFARLQRGVTYLRAAGFLLKEMGAGAMERRSRWPECVERAKWEV